MYTVCYRCGVVSDTPLCRNCLARGYTKDIPKDRIIGGVRKESDYNLHDEITREDVDLSLRQEREKRRRVDNFDEVEYNEDLDYEDL